MLAETRWNHVDHLTLWCAAYFSGTLPISSLKLTRKCFDVFAWFTNDCLASRLSGASCWQLTSLLRGSDLRRILWNLRTASPMQCPANLSLSGCYVVIFVRLAPPCLHDNVSDGYHLSPHSESLSRSERCSNPCKVGSGLTMSIFMCEMHSVVLLMCLPM